MDAELFDAVADEYRRNLLTRLLERELQPIQQLTGISRAISNGHEELLRRHLSSSRNIADVDEQLLRAHHIHLPKLEASDLIEWDRETNVVTRGPRFDEVRPILRLVTNDRDAFSASRPVEILPR